VNEIEECLKERDTSTHDLGLSSPANGDTAGPADHSSRANARSRNGAGGPSGPRLDKRQIEQRIEEDRERHKRMRENMWTVPRDIHEEAMKFYDETSDLGEDDHVLGEEEWDEFLREDEGVACEHTRKRVINGAEVR
jgi:CTD kinase subunit gamma